MTTQFIEFILPLFTFFKNETIAPSFALYMLIAAVLLLLLFLGQVLWKWGKIRFVFLARLNRNERTVRKERGLEGLPDAEWFAICDTLITKNSVLGPAWKQFRKTIIDITTDTAVVQLTVRPDEFFNLAALEHRALRLRWFSIVPGLFVSVGLLLTFIGLVAALFFTSQTITISSGDVAQQTALMQGALSQLLSAATFKFWTSVAGLLCSIFLKIFHGILLRLLASSLHSVCVVIEDHAALTTPESLAIKQLSLLDQQTAQLKDFSGQFAIALADSLQKVMPGIMQTAIEPMNTNLEKMTTNISSVNANALQQMTTDLGSTLTIGIGEELRNASTALSNATLSLTDISSTVETSGFGMSKGILDATNSLNVSIEKMTEKLDMAGANMKSSTEAAGQIFSQQIQDTIADLTRTVQSLNDQYGNATKQLGQTIAEIKDAGKKAVTDAGLALEETSATAVNLVANTTASAMTEFSDTTSKLHEAMSYLTQSVSNTSKNFESHINSLKGVNKETEGNRLALEKVAEAVRKAEEPLSKASTYLANAISQTGVLVRNSTSSLEQAQGEVQKLAANLSATVGELDKAWQKHATHFDKADANMAQAMQKIMQAQHSSAALVETFIKQVDDGLSRTVQTLSGNIEELTGFASEITEATKKMQTVSSQHHVAN